MPLQSDRSDSDHINPNRTANTLKHISHDNGQKIAVNTAETDGSLNRSKHHPLDGMMTGGARARHDGAGGRPVD